VILVELRWLVLQDATEENLTVALTPANRRRRSLTYAAPGQIRSGHQY